MTRRAQTLKIFGAKFQRNNDDHEGQRIRIFVLYNSRYNIDSIVQSLRKNSIS